MPDKKFFDIISEKNSRMKEKRIEILSMEPSKALEAIINEETPYPLVHSMPEEDFYFLMHDAGINDFLPVLAMASDRHWQYILDMEIWERDRITVSSLIKWFGILMDADLTRLVQWLMYSKLDVLEFFIERNIEIKIREHDQDPSELGDGFETIDDVFYFKPKKLFNEENEELLTADEEELKALLVDRILKGVAEFDYQKFQAILLESTARIAVETEEELYRERNIRLTDRGFLPFDEALGAYQPLAPWETTETGKKLDCNHENAYEDVLSSPPSFLPKMIASQDSLFRDLPVEFDRLELPSDFDLEMAALCNRITVADQKKARSRDELRHTVAKACGYISIGMADVSEKTGISPESVISGYHLLYLFRTGYTKAVKLQSKARQWIEKSWFRSKGLHLSFWGEEWMGIAGGLLLKRPLFFCNYENGLIYRDFRKTDDLVEAETALDSMMIIDNIFRLMDTDISLLPEEVQIHQAKPFIMTMWAGNFIAGAAGNQTGKTNNIRKASIPVSEFETFYLKLLENGIVSQEMKENFIDWLASQTGTDPSEIYEKSWPIFEKIFNGIESEYRYVQFEDIDSRFINFFYITP